MNTKYRFAKQLAVILLSLLGIANAHAAVNINYVVNNHLGAPVLLVDENQHVVWQAEYDEFGKATILVEEVEFNVRFPGQYYDKETGLTYNYYRDYDAVKGRYVQSDPRGIMLDFSDPQRQVASQLGTEIPYSKDFYLNHNYAYVDGNPLSYSDKTGEFGLAGAAGGAAFNLFLQLSSNLYLSDGDLIKSLKCINLTDILVSAAIGAAGPSALSNVLLGKAGPAGLTQVQNAFLYLTVSVPVGFSLKKGVPDVRPTDFMEDECTDCSDLMFTNILSEILQ